MKNNSDGEINFYFVIIVKAVIFDQIKKEKYRIFLKFISFSTSIIFPKRDF
jgi:hypothetical protein